MQSPRYLLDIFPAILMTISLFVIYLLQQKSLRIIGYTIIAFWILSGLYFTWYVSQDEDVYIQHTRIPGKDIVAMVDEVEDLGIEGVFAHKFFKTLILFYSHEEVIGSRFYYYRWKKDKIVSLSGISMLPQYEEKMRSIDNRGIVFAEKEHKLIAVFEKYLQQEDVKFSLKKIPSFRIYYNFGDKFTDSGFADFIRGSGYNRGEIEDLVTL